MSCRARIGVAFLLLVMGAVVACAPVRAAGAPVAAGHSTHDIGGRTYEMYRPAGLTGPAPLVVMLHGGYGDGAQAEKSYHWDAEADRGRFVAVFPNGIGKSWNAGTCCGPAQRTHVDDVGFIKAVVADVERTSPVDRRRIYVTGMSNGAMMAYRMACETDIFAAAAPVAGTILVPCAGARPISLLAIHGTADDRVPYGGGPGKAFSLDGQARVDGPSVPADNAAFRRINDCRSPHVVIRGVVSTSSAACPGGRTVELISIAGAGHQWPGSERNPRLSALGIVPEPSTALAATPTIWQFFAAHPR
ncbi:MULTISPECIES: extracellular catalytic domain type 1 short-chain-length polyhydroxyalkanoate depolymerase [unclassified Gordonia (in: high G+C Gram-positive bacteria)]